MRKLAICSLFFTLSTILSHYILPYSSLPIMFFISAALSLLGLICKTDNRYRILIGLLAFAVGFMWYWAYSMIFLSPVAEFHEQTRHVTAVVQTHPTSLTRGYRVDVNIRRDNGPNIGARLYYSTETMLHPGDIIEFSGRFTRTDGFDDTERIEALTSRGNFLTASISGGIEVVGTRSSILNFPQAMALSVSELVNRLFSGDSALFIQALLTGRRDDLYRDLSLSSALSASGIIHVVSISGMHVSFLMGFLGVFIRNKRLFPAIGIPVLLVFMAMTGFSPSVTRAGMMQVLLIFAPLLNRERDSLTSLSAALLLLLIMNPLSIGSIGLQLSFSATLGIILFSGRLEGAVFDAFRYTRVYESNIIRPVVRFATASFSTTVGALLFTIPLTAFHFGYVSIVAPLTNLLTLWAVSFAFSLGLVVVILGFVFFPLGSIAAYPLYLLVSFIIEAARFLAAMPYSAVYASQTPIMFWLVYVYIMFTLLPLMKARARQYLMPVCAVIISFALIVYIPSVTISNEGTRITVLDVGQGQSVVITSGDYTAVVDCGGGRGYNAGAIAHEYLLSRGRTTIELLAITHFHADHINGIGYLLSRVHVAVVAMPEMSASPIAEEIAELAIQRGAEVIIVTETMLVPFGETDLIIYPPVGRSGDNERGLAVLTYGGLDALITGDMASATERSLLRYADLPPVDLLVVGHHGSRFSTSEELLSSITPSVGAISVGRNSYGHPHPDVLLRLETYYVTVLRTDFIGNITVIRHR